MIDAFTTTNGRPMRNDSLSLCVWFRSSSCSKNCAYRDADNATGKGIIRPTSGGRRHSPRLHMRRMKSSRTILAFANRQRPSAAHGRRSLPLLTSMFVI